MKTEHKKTNCKKRWGRIACVVASFVMLLTASGCGNEKQDALLDYINKDMVEIADLEEKMLESYNSVSGTNYTDDLTMYNEINETTIPLCHQLSEAVAAVAPADKEIAAVHNTYSNFVSKYLNAMAMINAAIETQDYAQVATANDLIAEANNLSFQYQQELRTLAEERNVTFENK